MAAKQGYVEAQYNLGHMYYLGEVSRGAPQCCIRGVRWELVQARDVQFAGIAQVYYKTDRDKGAIGEECMWPRDSYTGPGGGLYTGPGGGLYTGPGGGAYTGPGGGLYTGPGGGLYTGPGGGLYAGPGGGLYAGPGGGLYAGPGGGLYTGPGGGLYTGPGGGLYTGPSDPPYYSNWPTREILIRSLESRGHKKIARRLRRVWRL